MKAPIKGKHYKKITRLPAAVGIVLALILIGIAGARYMYQTESGGSIKAKEFYFTSNLLDGQSHTLAPGSRQITFTVGNHADALRVSEVPIDYSVKVDGSTPHGSGLEGTLAADSMQDETVTITDLEPGRSYTVTVEGVGGYHKTLKATLVIPAEEQYLYKSLETSGGYVLLKVWSQGVAGDVTITAPDTVQPDNTDAVMAEAKTGETFTDTVSFKDLGYCAHAYRFFGSGVTASDFAVKCGDIFATEKAPN